MWKTRMLFNLTIRSTILVFCLSTQISAQQKEDYSVVVGVRSDAKPFSYSIRHRTQITNLPGSPRQNNFDGYMVYVCMSVLDALSENISLDVQTRVVNAQDRFGLLHSGEVDVLCDPSTITSSRMKDFNLVSSTPLYMSAITFATSPYAFNDECRSYVGVVAATTSEVRGIREIVESQSWPRFGDEILSVYRSNVPDQRVENCNDPVIRKYTSHDQLARDFCAGKVLYYVGDVEIIRSNIERAKCLPTSSIAPAIFSDERYGIFLRIREDSDFPLLFLRELSRQVFSDPSVLSSAFDETFGKSRVGASEKLKAFFWSLSGTYPNAQ